MIRFFKKQYKGFLVGIMMLAIFSGVIAGVISTAKTASDGDVITASAWNDLVSKLNSGGGSGIDCSSEGEAGCVVQVKNNDAGTWECKYGWDLSVGKCNGLPTVDGTESLPGTSCLNLLNNGVDTSGLYWIELSDSTKLQVYCNMDTSIAGGGWTLVVRGTTSAEHVNSSAVGVLTSPSQTTSAKLSDDHINLIPKTLYMGTDDLSDSNNKIECQTYFDTSSPFNASSLMTNKATNDYPITDSTVWTQFTDNGHSGLNSHEAGVGYSLGCNFVYGTANPSVGGSMIYPKYASAWNSYGGLV